MKFEFDNTISLHDLIEKLPKGVDFRDVTIEWVTSSVECGIGDYVETKLVVNVKGESNNDKAHEVE